MIETKLQVLGQSHTTPRGSGGEIVISFVDNPYRVIDLSIGKTAKGESVSPDDQLLARFQADYCWLALRRVNYSLNDALNANKKKLAEILISKEWKDQDFKGHYRLDSEDRTKQFLEAIRHSVMDGPLAEWRYFQEEKRRHQREMQFQLGRRRRRNR